MPMKFKQVLLRLFACYYAIFFKIRKKTVVFHAYGGLNYSCNPRAISEALHKLHPEYRIIWCFKNPEKMKEIVPDYVRVIQKGSLAELKACYTASGWVFNRGSSFLFKRKRQFYLDTWHGDRAFKRVGISANGKMSLRKVYHLADAVISGSEYGDEIIRTSMDFSGEILGCGSPRNDLFFHYQKKDIDRIKKEIGVGRDSRVLMYAPTFRDHDESYPLPDFSRIISLLEKKTGEKWCCLWRGHYKNYDKALGNISSKIIDATRYNDMQELLLVTDLLISDYSSSVGDFALLNRSILLYVPDLENYRKTRGLNFKLEDSPYLFAENSEALYRLVEDMDLEAASQNCKAILDFYGTYGENGTASEQAVEWILKHS